MQVSLKILHATISTRLSDRNSRDKRGCDPRQPPGTPRAAAHCAALFEPGAAVAEHGHGAALTPQLAATSGHGRAVGQPRKPRLGVRHTPTGGCRRAERGGRGSAGTRRGRDGGGAGRMAGPGPGTHHGGGSSSYDRKRKGSAPPRGQS